MASVDVNATHVLHNEPQCNYNSTWIWVITQFYVFRKVHHFSTLPLCIVLAHTAFSSDAQIQCTQHSQGSSVNCTMWPPSFFLLCSIRAVGLLTFSCWDGAAFEAKYQSSVGIGMLSLWAWALFTRSKFSTLFRSRFERNVRPTTAVAIVWGVKFLSPVIAWMNQLASQFVWEGEQV